MEPQAKLTIRVQRQWLENAKQYATRHDTTLTRLVSEYLRYLGMRDTSDSQTPILHRLTGILPSDISTEEHYRYLDSKYGSQTAHSG